MACQCLIGYRKISGNCNIHTCHLTGTTWISFANEIRKPKHYSRTAQCMKAETAPRFTVAMSALIAGGIIMGFSPVFVREAEVGAFASAFWRTFFAMPVLAAWCLFDARSKSAQPSQGISSLSVLAGIFFAGDLIFWHLAILNTTMANATFMVCLAPVWVAVLSPVLISEKSGKNSLAGLLMCLVGMGLLIHSSMRLNPDRLLGDMFGIITSLFLGLYFIAIRAARKSESSSRLFANSTAVTTIVLLLAALLMEASIFPASTKGWLSVASLGVLTHALGQGLVAVAIGVLSAMFSSLVIFLEAVAAAFFGWLIFAEELDSIQLIGGAIILAGVWHARPRNERANP